MSWLIRSRRFAYLAIGCGVLELVSCALSSVQLPFVSIRSPVVHVHVELAMTVAIPIAWTACLARSSPIEPVAVRPIRVILGGYAIGVVVIVALTGRLADVLFGGDAGLATARNIAAMIGIVLFVFPRWHAHAAALIPSCYFVAAVIAGETRSHEVDWWAIPIAPAHSHTAGLLAVGALIAGLLAFMSEHALASASMRRRRPPCDHD